MSHFRSFALAVAVNKIRLIEQENPIDYDTRNRLVVAAVAEAMRSKIPAGFRIDSANPEWPVAFIELPTGQVSWHLPQHINEWDKHSTEEKHKRIEEYRHLFRESSE